MSDRHQRRSLDESAEKPEVLEGPSREQLQMHVVEFNERNQPEACGYLAHLLGLICGEIHGEPKEVLRFWTAAYRLVLADVSEPRCVYDIRVKLTQDHQAFNEVLIQRKEWL